MAGYIGNEKLLVHFFQDSLIGSAADWYVRLNRLHVRFWKNLAKAFVTHYKHVVNTTPDRLSLQNLEQKSAESFNEYAQRWWDLATQVQSPLTERETIKIGRASCRERV